MNNFAIDSHKLIYHPHRVSDWSEGKDIYPIYVEISAVNRCNYRCCFCAFDYTGYQGDIFSKDSLNTAISEMADCGVKSIVFAGTGEPLLHPNIADFVTQAVKSGIDVGMSTNGALLKEEISRTLVENLSWIRISFNAGSPGSYSEIHGCPEIQYDLVQDNIRKLVKLKKELNSTITIGAQCLILDKNQHELLSLTREMKTIGVDYFSLKPYSQHPDSIHQQSIKPQAKLAIADIKNIESVADNNFRVIIRKNSLAALNNTEKPYDKCLGLPFLCYLEADGYLYACNTFMGDKLCAYGNLNENSFQEVWRSERKQKVIDRLSSMVQKKCRQACRLDQINQYLCALKNPPAHVNFI